MTDALQLTPLRRDVFDLVKASPRPIKAYELLAQLSERRGRVTPPTVYRALNFLAAEGFIHRIESLHAFSACPHPSPQCDHVFLICECCGLVAELDAGGDAEVLRAICANAGFDVALVSQEARGLCRACAASQAEAGVGA